MNCYPVNIDILIRPTEASIPLQVRIAKISKLFSCLILFLVFCNFSSVAQVPVVDSSVLNTTDSTLKNKLQLITSGIKISAPSIKGTDSVFKTPSLAPDLNTDSILKSQLKSVKSGIRLQAPTIPNADSILKAGIRSLNPVNSINKIATPKVPDIDSTLNSQFQSISSKVVNSITASVNSSISGLRKNLNTKSLLPKIDKGAIKKLKKFQVYNSLLSAEANDWEEGSNNNLYLQKIVSTDANIIGIPVSAGVIVNTNYLNSQKAERIIYKLNYTRDGLLDNLKIDKADIKSQLAEKLDFDKQINYQQVVSDAFSGIPSVNDLLTSSGCNWRDLAEMPMDEFSKLYSQDSLKSKMADAVKLKTYYDDYVAHSKDSVSALVRSKQQMADSNITKLKTSSELYANVIKLKTAVDNITKKVQELRKTYEEKVKQVIDAYDVVSGVVKGNKDISGIQKLMTKVKGLSIGQHTITTGNIVLQNYIQNGVTLEYETEKNYILLTKGSQKKIDDPGSFFQNSANTQTGVNEYYQYNSRYMLTGVSLGNGNKDRYFQQVSLMNFKKIDNPQYPALVSKNVTVITAGNKLSLNGTKLDYELSKSIVKQENKTTGNHVSDDNTPFFKSIGLAVKYQTQNKYTQSKHKADIFYSSDLYNNPGLNGGILRPGFQFNDKFEKKIGKRIKLSNQAGYYSFKYGNTASVKSIREKINVSYKIKQIRLGLLFYGSYANQIQKDPKSIYKTKSFDLLGTTQTSRRFGKFFWSISDGIGYGITKQDFFNNTKNISFFVNTNINYKALSLDVNMDKFSTTNTEVFLSDSSALILSSSFNLDGSLIYTTEKGNLFQAGMLYKKFDKVKNQFFIMANLEWKLFKKISIGGSLNLPLSSPTTDIYANNLFNTKLTYNIKGHEK